MSGYLFALLVLSLSVSIIGILSPEGKSGGISRYIKLLSSLLLLTLLVSPLPRLLSAIRSWQENGFSLPQVETQEEELRDQIQSALDGESQSYFVQMLTQTITQKFALTPGEVSCVAAWSVDGSTPVQITVLLSGSSIWKDPAPIKAFVEELLSCPCDVAIA